MPFEFHLEDETFQKILISLVIILGTIVLVKVGQRVALRYIEDPSRRYRTAKLLGRLGSLVALFAIIALWSPRGRDVLTLLTVIGAGLAIAMREALLSFAGWMNIALRTPYTQGDRIQVNDVRGDVIDIRLIHTTLMEVGGWVEAEQSSGRIVHIPNSWIFQHPLYNYTRGFGFIWNEYALTLTFRSDWQAARDIMLSFAQESAAIVEQQAAQQIRRMSREYLIHYSILTPFVYVKIVPNGIRLSLRYLCEVRKRRGTEHALTLSILAAFEEHGGIELAYPTTGISVLDSPQFGPMPDGTPQRHDPDALRRNPEQRGTEDG